MSGQGGEKKKRRRIFGKPPDKLQTAAVSQAASPSAEVEHLRALLDQQKRARCSLESQLLVATKKTEAIEEELKNRDEQCALMTEHGVQTLFTTPLSSFAALQCVYYVTGTSSPI